MAEVSTSVGLRNWSCVVEVFVTEPNIVDSVCLDATVKGKNLAQFLWKALK